MIDLSLAVPVGDYQIVVVHEDGAVEKFGRFGSESGAIEWAMENRDALGLVWCSSWHCSSVGGDSA